MRTGMTVTESAAAAAIAYVLVKASGAKSLPSWASSVKTGKNNAGNINTGGDVYRHQVDLLYGGNCVFQTTLITMPDTTMTLLNQSLSQMAFNDDSGGTLASQIQAFLVPQLDAAEIEHRVLHGASDPLSLVAFFPLEKRR